MFPFLGHGDGNALQVSAGWSVPTGREPFSVEKRQRGGFRRVSTHQLCMEHLVDIGQKLA